jgi:hypothetical protein
MFSVAKTLLIFRIKFDGFYHELVFLKYYGKVGREEKTRMLLVEDLERPAFVILPASRIHRACQLIPFYASGSASFETRRYLVNRHQDHDTFNTLFFHQDVENGIEADTAVERQAEAQQGNTNRDEGQLHAYDQLAKALLDSVTQT